MPRDPTWSLPVAFYSKYFVRLSQLPCACYISILLHSAGLIALKIICRKVEWKRNLVAHGDAREEKWRGKMRMEWVAKQSSVSLGTVHPVLLQSFSPDPHSKKASTRLNRHPRPYKWTRPFRWKTESGFCACAITFRFHSTNKERNRQIKKSQLVSVDFLFT